eukprot:TRINITY_DN11_c0_g1_i4.p1 TRINITY_DN11_c0_g1~~TRINITY_DN11_c0_g1_i4.p1  ORF type:complete len:104 (+),score=24.54 TRINITY_DN11_c0_g1_i4:62-373(+)
MCIRDRSVSVPMFVPMSVPMSMSVAVAMSVNMNGRRRRDVNVVAVMVAVVNDVDNLLGRRRRSMLALDVADDGADNFLLSLLVLALALLCALRLYHEAEEDNE